MDDKIKRTVLNYLDAFRRRDNSRTQVETGKWHRVAMLSRSEYVNGCADSGSRAEIKGWRGLLRASVFAYDGDLSIPYLNGGVISYALWVRRDADGRLGAKVSYNFLCPLRIAGRAPRLMTLDHDIVGQLPSGVLYGEQTNRGTT